MGTVIIVKRSKRINILFIHERHMNSIVNSCL